MVKLDDKWGFVDRKGMEIIPVVCDAVNDFLEEVTTIQENDQWFIVDTLNNRKPVPYTSKGISSFNEGVAAFEMGGKRGLMDKKTKIIAAPKYDIIFYFHDGLALVELDEKQGFVNTKGQEVIPLIYDNFPGFKDGYAAVSIQDKYGFIDKTGKMVIPAKYRDVYDFYDGLARVSIGGKLGCINAKGELVIPAVYSEIMVGEGVLGVIVEGKGQFLDLTGKPLFPEVYENVYGFSDGAALVKKNGNWFFY